MDGPLVDESYGAGEEILAAKDPQDSDNCSFDVQETLTEDLAEPDRVIETEIPEDVEEAPSKMLETHGVTTLVHEMQVDGFHLVERKQKINVDPKAFDNTPKMTLINHSGSIDDRCYDVQKTFTVSICA